MKKCKHDWVYTYEENVPTKRTCKKCPATHTSANHKFVVYRWFDENAQLAEPTLELKISSITRLLHKARMIDPEQKLTRMTSSENMNKQWMIQTWKDICFYKLDPTKYKRRFDKSVADVMFMDEFGGEGEVYLRINALGSGCIYRYKKGSVTVIDSAQLTKKEYEELMHFYVHTHEKGTEPKLKL